jgi:hypothetical protein
LARGAERFLSRRRRFIRRRAIKKKRAERSDTFLKTKNPGEPYATLRGR